MKLLYFLSLRTHTLPLSSYTKLPERLKDVSKMGVELTLLHALYILCLLTIITFFYSSKKYDNHLYCFLSFY